VNYYERHLGDYAKQTAHLSMLEHGAYTLLLDRYYGTEKPIPAGEAYRVVRARTREERKAVDVVLREFFVIQGTDWVHGRCEEEIEKAQRRIAAARTNGVKGGRPKPNPEATQQKPDGLELGSNQLTQTKALQSPDSNLHTPDSRKKPPVSPLPTRGKALADARATPGLDVEAFDRWIGYRAERKPALKPVSFKAAAEKLSAHGTDQMAVVLQSIAEGYQGLFPLKLNGSSGAAKLTWKPPDSDFDENGQPLPSA
jgi:uncharacterized protein YdaU (DUF1376 family)